MVNYKCDVCKFETKNKFNLNAHFLTNKHIKMSKDDNKTNARNARNTTNHKQKNAKKVKKVKETFNCTTCNAQFTTRQAKSRHELHRCTKPAGISIDIVKEIVQAAVNALGDKYFGNKTVNNNTYNDNKKVYNKNVYNTILNITTDNPMPLMIEDYGDIFPKNDSKNRLENMFLHNFEQNSLHMYIGDMIVNHYRNKDPLKQTIWTRDVQRLNYVLTIVTNNICRWYNDKGGVHVKKSIIQPVVDYVKQLMEDYYDELSGKVKNSKESKFHISIQMKLCYELGKYIETPKIGEDILKYIAKFFTMNNIQAKKIIDAYENNKILLLKNDEDIQDNIPDNIQENIQEHEDDNEDDNEDDQYSEEKDDNN